MRLLIPTLLLVFHGPALAEITHQNDSGFESQNTIQTTVAPERAWQALVEEVGQWWHPDHTFFGDAASLSIDPRPQGCFCESHSSGGVQHLQVINAQRPKLLRLRGGLGPLQEQAVAGSLTFAISESDSGSSITLTYRVGGFLPAGFEAWAPPVDSVLAIQLERLRRHLAKEPLDGSSSP